MAEMVTDEESFTPGMPQGATLQAGSPPSRWALIFFGAAILWLLLVSSIER